jgi:hypothetical protein
MGPCLLARLFPLPFPLATQKDGRHTSNPLARPRSPARSFLPARRAPACRPRRHRAHRHRPPQRRPHHTGSRPCPAALAQPPLPSRPCPAALAQPPLPSRPCPAALAQGRHVLAPRLHTLMQRPQHYPLARFCHDLTWRTVPARLPRPGMRQPRPRRRRAHRPRPAPRPHGQGFAGRPATAPALLRAPLGFLSARARCPLHGLCPAPLGFQAGRRLAPIWGCGTAARGTAAVPQARPRVARCGRPPLFKAAEWHPVWANVRGAPRGPAGAPLARPAGHPQPRARRAHAAADAAAAAAVPPRHEIQGASGALRAEVGEGKGAQGPRAWRAAGQPAGRSRPAPRRRSGPPRAPHRAGRAPNMLLTLFSIFPVRTRAPRGGQGGENQKRRGRGVRLKPRAGRRFRSFKCPQITFPASAGRARRRPAGLATRVSGTPPLRLPAGPRDLGLCALPRPHQSNIRTSKCLTVPAQPRESPHAARTSVRPRSPRRPAAALAAPGPPKGR